MEHHLVHERAHTHYSPAAFAQVAFARWAYGGRIESGTCVGDEDSQFVEAPLQSDSDAGVDAIAAVFDCVCARLAHGNADIVDLVWCEPHRAGECADSGAYA